MLARWDMSSCGGGLKWQIYPGMAGYTYKNSISNACLFHIAARLYRFTGNDTYLDTANLVWDWMYRGHMGLVQYQEDSNSYTIFDGFGTESNCTTVSVSDWSYNYGLMMSGAAYLYNATEANQSATDTNWGDELERFYNSFPLFVNSTNDIIFEKRCVERKKCNNDQRSFKSIYSRTLALTAKLAPEYADEIYNILHESALGAAKSCSGGTDNHTCGMDWELGRWDGLYGLGEQMSALEVIQNTLFEQYPGPLTKIDVSDDVKDYNDQDNVSSACFPSSSSSAVSSSVSTAGGSSSSVASSSSQVSSSSKAAASKLSTGLWSVLFSLL
ncbi:unnamed protein product [Ambrosiozyma monospora]|uniref:Unnamed protein product n=1 Tax=Ambrosiozyma monospora TaxID=43982 RepID=A0ACB5SRX3_AMBMO|nr:unnamed protein product [Ambrosiozyma monospora]